LGVSRDFLKPSGSLFGAETRAAAKEFFAKTKRRRRRS